MKLLSSQDNTADWSTLYRAWLQMSKRHLAPNLYCYNSQQRTVCPRKRQYAGIFLYTVVPSNCFISINISAHHIWSQELIGEVRYLGSSTEAKKLTKKLPQKTGRKLRFSLTVASIWQPTTLTSYSYKYRYVYISLIILFM